MTKRRKGAVPAPAEILPDGSGVVWVVSYRSPITGTIEALPDVMLDFQEALTAAAEMIEDDPRADPSVIQVVIDPEITALRYGRTQDPADGPSKGK